MKLLELPADFRESVAEAIERSESFSGMEAAVVGAVDIEEIDVAFVIGTCDGILYTAVRDGVEERLEHEFDEDCRPLLAASASGEQLLLIGGAFEVTDRGIVDRC